MAIISLNSSNISQKIIYKSNERCVSMIYVPQGEEQIRKCVNKSLATAPFQ